LEEVLQRLRERPGSRIEFEQTAEQRPAGLFRHQVSLPAWNRLTPIPRTPAIAGCPPPHPADQCEYGIEPIMKVHSRRSRRTGIIPMHGTPCKLGNLLFELMGHQRGASIRVNDSKRQGSNQQ
jgi:hypothetical protein